MGAASNEIDVTICRHHGFAVADHSASPRGPTDEVGPTRARARKLTGEAGPTRSPANREPVFWGRILSDEDTVAWIDLGTP